MFAGTRPPLIASGKENSAHQRIGLSKTGGSINCRPDDLHHGGSSEFGGATQQLDMLGDEPLQSDASIWDFRALK